ncbi:MAG: hypothetical protein JWN45_26 [Acidobacteriaceae bacterium]|nr:hypothetical protein [Acidobacteriaceae bacterium]
MNRYLGIALSVALGLLFCAFTAYGAEDVSGAVEGTVKKTDAAAKTVVVKSADGTEHTFHVVDRTTVHGAEASGKGAEETFHGVKEGSHVVVHYSTKGTEDTAEEIDHVGKGGMKVTEGTVKGIDRGAKTIAVKTADGTEETFRLTDHAAKDAGKGIGEGAEKTGKVTVYYTEQGGEKVAHFFKKVF